MKQTEIYYFQIFVHIFYRESKTWIIIYYQSSKIDNFSNNPSKFIECLYRKSALKLIFDKKKLFCLFTSFGGFWVVWKPKSGSFLAKRFGQALVPPLLLGVHLTRNYYSFDVAPMQEMKRHWMRSKLGF